MAVMLEDGTVVKIPELFDPEVDCEKCRGWGLLGSGKEVYQCDRCDGYGVDPDKRPKAGKNAAETTGTKDLGRSPPSA